MENTDQFAVPVLLIMFNRPQYARQVFEQIRKIRPSVFYLAVDGPRPDRPDESDAVAHCRQIRELVDWPCRVATLFQDENKGCKNAVSSAINWFFSHEEYGIILEDDCLPDLTFFTFCRELLIRYQHDERVMHIGGANLVAPKRWNDDSYLFTKVCHIWGWATWRRAWRNYDVQMANYNPESGNRIIAGIVENERSRKHWQRVFTLTWQGKANTWDYQWVYAIWKSAGLCILPVNNLITNIGFDALATHTQFNSPFANLPSTPIPVLTHPNVVSSHQEATQYLFQTLYQPTSTITGLMQRVRRKLTLLKIMPNK